MFLFLLRFLVLCSLLTIIVFCLFVPFLSYLCVFEFSAKLKSIFLSWTSIPYLSLNSSNFLRPLSRRLPRKIVHKKVQIYSLSRFLLLSNYFFALDINHNSIKVKWLCVMKEDTNGSTKWNFGSLKSFRKKKVLASSVKNRKS